MKNNNTSFLTVEEVADKLSVTTRTIQKMLREERIKGKKLGKRWYILTEDLIGLLVC